MKTKQVKRFKSSEEKVYGYYDYWVEYTDGIKERVMGSAIGNLLIKHSEDEGATEYSKDGFVVYEFSDEYLKQ